MSKDIRIKKGLNINLVGEADLTTSNISVKGVFALKPENFHGIIPKLIAKEGTEVKAGESLFYSKSDNWTFNSDIVKEKAKNYMEKIKETNPEKLKEWRHQAYLNRKAKLKEKEDNK